MQNIKKSHAFTLIELLVVISIIALLVGILLPALGNARRTAREMRCLTQARSYGTAMFTYQADMGTMPPYLPYQTDRSHASGPIVMTMLLQEGYMGVEDRSDAQRCPIVDGLYPTHLTDWQATLDNDRGAFTYGMNAWIGGYLHAYGFSTFTESNGTVSTGWNPNGGGYNTANYNSRYVLKPFASDDVPETSRTMLFSERNVPNTTLIGTTRHSAGIRAATDSGIAHPQQTIDVQWDVRNTTLTGRVGTTSMIYADGSGDAVSGQQTTSRSTGTGDGFDVDREIIYDFKQ